MISRPVLYLRSAAVALAASLLAAGLPHASAEPMDAGPDLVVTGVAFEPAQPFAGDKVSLKVTVENRGTGATPEGVVLGGVWTLNDAVVAWTDTHKAALQPNESVTLTSNGGGPYGDGTWAAREGTYRVGMLIDDVNRIPEENETNNSFAVAEPLVVAARTGPNLVVRRVTWTPTDLHAGQRVQLAAEVVNIGTEPTPAGVPTRVALAVDGRTAATVSGPGGLAPGKAVTLTAPTDQRWQATQGMHDVVATADPSGAVDEAREDDNVRAIDLAVDVPQTEIVKQADAFVDSIGVNVHLSYYDTTYGDFYGIVEPRLAESGIRYVRDGAVHQDLFVARMRHLGAAHGIRADIITGSLSPAEDLGLIKRLGDMVVSIEGPNEWNIFRPDQFPEGLRAFQHDLHARAKADLDLADVPVYAPSLAYGGEVVDVLGPVPCDVANAHSYPAGSIPSRNLTANLQAAKAICPDKPVVSTESGYHNAVNATSGQPSTSEQASGKYVPSLLLGYFAAGVQRTYLYEFLDEFADPSRAEQERNFGLVRSDGTPKPAYMAVKNLIGLLSDPGPAFTPSAEQTLVSGDVTNVRTVTLAKRDGRRYVALWQEVPTYDQGGKTDLENPSHAITLSFVGKKTFDVYAPVRSEAPIDRIAKTRRVTVQVPDEPIVVEVHRP